tara:strand:- start:6445 stop:7083 length:639 start_codon:yes stop_codon:yes gene_type:complete
MVKKTQLRNTNTGAFLFSNTKSCMNGGSKGYGVTMDSLAKASNAGLGRGYTGAVTYKNCGQNGGAMAVAGNHDMGNSYGYVDGNDKVNNMFRGSYAPVKSLPSKQGCSGGAKKKKKRRKRRKSRKSMKNKKRSRYSKSRKRKSRRKRRKSKKTRRRRRRKNMRGGSTMNYSVIDSGLKGNDARILGSHSYITTENCGDGYNHFTGGQTKSLY